MEKEPQKTELSLFGSVLMLVIALVMAVMISFAWFMINREVNVNGFDQQVISMPDVSLSMTVDGSEITKLGFDNSIAGEVYKCEFSIRNNSSTAVYPTLNFLSITASGIDVNGDGVADTSLLDVFAIDYNIDNGTDGIDLTQLHYLSDEINLNGDIAVFNPTTPEYLIQPNSSYNKIIYIMFCETPRAGTVYNDINDYQQQIFNIGKIKVGVSE